MLSGSPPLGGAEFAALMARLGPFEPAPELAVALSGGADSLALAILADGWARDRGGRVIGLTVDHGLRPESALEAERVGRWMAERGIAHHTLRWQGAKPATGIEAAARRARYDLLERWCGTEGILHLLLAHHRDDQAETVLLHLSRGSGVDGLAGMAWIAERRELRLIRPLLEIPRARLQAALEAAGQSWIEDPSNLQPRFKRARIRRLLAEEGIDAARLAATAKGMGRARQCLETLTARALAGCAFLATAGYARLDVGLWRNLPEETRLRALSALCRSVGGQVHPLRLDRLDRAAGALMDGLSRRRTFAGCVLVPDGQRVLLCREPAAVAPPLRLSPGERTLWDGRFAVVLHGEGGTIAALGGAGWRAIRNDMPHPPSVPAAVLPSLPTILDENGIVSVPHLGYKKIGRDDIAVASVVFAPARALAPAEHCLV